MVILTLGQDKYACEFYGCNWHGCPKCYIRDRESIGMNGKSISLRYKETLIKEQRLKELGFKLITKWSCDFKLDLVQDSSLNSFVENLNIAEPINHERLLFWGKN